MKLHKIAKILLIPMIASVTLVGNNVTVKAQGNKEEIVQDFYESIINKDIDSILKYSEDLRFTSIEERKITLEILGANPNEDIVKYEILDDGNPNDENFLVKEYYRNGEIIENNIKTNEDKVVLSTSEEQTSKVLKEGKQIPLSDKQNEEYNSLIEKRNRADMGYWNTTLSKSGSTMSKLQNFTNKSGATIQYKQTASSSPSVKYHLYNIKLTTVETLLLFTQSGNNSTVKNRSTSLDKNKRYGSTRVEVVNTGTPSVKVSGNLYIS